MKMKYYIEMRKSES